MVLWCYGHKKFFQKKIAAWCVFHGNGSRPLRSCFLKMFLFLTYWNGVYPWNFLNFAAWQNPVGHEWCSVLIFHQRRDGVRHFPSFCKAPITFHYNIACFSNLSNPDNVEIVWIVFLNFVFKQTVQKILKKQII